MAAFFWGTAGGSCIDCGGLCVCVWSGGEIIAPACGTAAASLSGAGCPCTQLCGGRPPRHPPLPASPRPARTFAGSGRSRLLVAFWHRGGRPGGGHEHHTKLGLPARKGPAPAERVAMRSAAGRCGRRAGHGHAAPSSGEPGPAAGRGAPHSSRFPASSPFLPPGPHMPPTHALTQPEAAPAHSCAGKGKRAPDVLDARGVKQVRRDILDLALLHQRPRQLHALDQELVLAVWGWEGSVRGVA